MNKMPYCPNGCHLSFEHRDECPEHREVPDHALRGIREEWLVGEGPPTDEAQWLSELPYDKYLETDHWQKKRLHILARSDYTCAGCRGHRHLEVHHLTYERRGYERNEDLVVLCRVCHAAAHGLVAS